MTASPAAILPAVATIGFPAPDFELLDHRGQIVRLRDRLGGGGAVIVFFRGHWCPYCRRYLGKLQANLDRFRAAGTTLLVISPEPPATSAALARDLGLHFPLLSDADGRTISSYGVRNGFVGGSTLLPHPGVFVADRDGVLRFRSVDRNFKKRTTVRAIFGAIEAAREE